MAGLIVAAGVMTVAALLTAHRLVNIRKLLGYAAVIDVLFTVLMFMMFMGTFSGIVAGAFGGLFMTGALYVLRYAIGYEKLCRRGVKLVWIRYNGAFA
jgi:hypothetical protein